MRPGTSDRNDEQVGPEDPARQTGIGQAALQASCPEDGQQREAVCDGQQRAMTPRMGAQQVERAAAEHHYQQAGEQECDAAFQPVQR